MRGISRRQRPLEHATIPSAASASSGGSMERRRFIQHAGIAGILATGTAPAIAQGQAGEVRWRCTSSFPKSLDTIYGGAEVVSKRVAALTNNRFRIQVFAGGEIVPGLQALDAVTNATVECCHTVPYYFVGKDLTFGFGATMPFGLNARQQFSWMYHGGGLALMREFYKDYGVISFPAGNTGAQMGGWFRKEIKTVADLKGLKYRIGGYAGQVLAKLGVVPQQIAGGDIYPSLEKGTIDGAEWVGPYDDEKLGFAKVAKYYYYPGWWEGGPQIDMFVGIKAWEALPADFKSALEVACMEANLDMIAKYDALNPPALRRLVAGGTQLRAFPREVMDACFKAAQESYDENAAKNAKFRKVYEQWVKHRDEQLLWFRVAEAQFDNYMQGVSGRAAVKKS
jgi:TRAP-type mannitol/chloroaromatic compound transport system substrate-binding protein